MGWHCRFVFFPSCMFSFASVSTVFISPPPHPAVTVTCECSHRCSLRARIAEGAVLTFEQRTAFMVRGRQLLQLPQKGRGDGDPRSEFFRRALLRMQ